MPVNYNLLSVNVFVAMTGLYQLWRLFQYGQFAPILSSSSSPLSHLTHTFLICVDIGDRWVVLGEHNGCATFCDYSL